MIVKMSKISITGLTMQRNAIVRRIMKYGAVQLSEIPLTNEERTEALSITTIDNASVRISEIEQELKKIKSAITFLDSIQTKQIKQKKTELDFESFVDPQTYKNCWNKVFTANELEKNLLNLNIQKNIFFNDLQFLYNWEQLNIPLDITKTQTSNIFIGTIPSSVDKDMFLNSINELKLTTVNIVNSDATQYYICVICHSSVYKETNEILQLNSFSSADFKNLTGTATLNINLIKESIANLDNQLHKLTKKTQENIKNLNDIKMLYDYIFNMQERRQVRHFFMHTQNAFIVGGFVPSDIAQTVKSDLEKDFNSFVEIIGVCDDDDSPVMLINNSFVYPHELITELYSLPKYKTLDPTPIMSIFYFMFFGLMVSDAGYGILISIMSAVALLLLKPTDTVNKLLRLMFLGGLSTTFWGALFGGWFGDFFYQAFGITIKPLWFNPLDDPMRLLVWSFIFGGIHLFAGMGIKAYSLIKQGKWADAIMDVGSWYVVLLGCAALFFGGEIATIGKYSAIVGGIALLLTQGRHEKNIFKKFTSGLLSLYNITGFLSDILSYSRLLALGLATGVIATVINTVGMLGGGFKTIGGAITIIIAFIVGHVFNIAINALGAYVHSSRLQYVEFFGKFYESGGKPFKPVKVKTKYINIIK